MPDLRKALGDNGFTNSRSLLASGNLIVESPLRSTAKVNDAVAAIINDLTGLNITVISRTKAQWSKLVAGNPFEKAAVERPKQLHAAVLAGRPTADDKTLTDLLIGDEKAKLVGDVLYVDYAEGVQKTKLGGAQLDKRLGVKATARNWNTVLAIAKLLD